MLCEGVVSLDSMVGLSLTQLRGCEAAHSRELLLTQCPMLMGEIRESCKHTQGVLMGRYRDQGCPREKPSPTLSGLGPSLLFWYINHSRPSSTSHPLPWLFFPCISVCQMYLLYVLASVCVYMCVCMCLYTWRPVVTCGYHRALTGTRGSSNLARLSRQ